MQVDNNFLSIFKVLFNERYKWEYVTDKQKEEFFFIVNRHLSKKYLKQSKLLNSKTINKVSAMNIWFKFLENEPYPNWFWSKSSVKKPKGLLTKPEYNKIRLKLKISEDDMNFLIEEHPDFIKEENKNMKKLEKQK